MSSLNVSHASVGIAYTVVSLINATKQFWYALQNPKWRSK